MNEERSFSLLPRFLQSGLLLDANLLLVLVVGRHNASWLGRRKRVKEYGAGDLDLLVRFVGVFNRILTTPNILTEVNSLSNSTTAIEERAAFALTFRVVLSTLTERYPRSEDAIALPIMARLGLTDASIEHVARHRHAFVLSADDDLVWHLHLLGLPALTFGFLRRLPLRTPRYEP